LTGAAGFYVTPEREGAGGAFTEIRSFRDGPSCVRWMSETGNIGCGRGGVRRAVLVDEEAASLRDILQPAAEFDYLREYGYSGSATACGISMFVKLYQGKTLLHINRDQRGNYAVIELQQF